MEMNDRIRELRNQAFDWVQQQLCTVGSDHPVMQSEQLEMTNQKFAELIIRECYQHCKDQLMDKKLAEEAGLDYNDGVMDCAIGLKQHFGVEE